MATTKLTKAQKDDFVRRLDTYCLTEEEVMTQDNLVVSSCSTVTLSASPTDSSYARPRMLQTSDLDVLKRWIGVEDRLVKGKCTVHSDHRKELRELRSHLTQATSRGGDRGEQDRQSPAKTRTFAADVKAGKNATARLDAIRAHARSYLFGDSTLVGEAKPVVEAFFKIFQVPLWLFPKVTVKSGSLLLFGPGVNVLNVVELEIEEGGQIVSTGSLTVNVTTLRKSMPLVVLADLPVFVEGM